MSLLFEHDVDGRQEQGKAEQIPGVKGFAQVADGEAGEDNKGNDLLRHLELEAGQSAHGPIPVGRHHEAILQEGDAPTDQYGFPEREFLEFQMAVPGKGHEDVGEGEQQDGADHIQRIRLRKYSYSRSLFPIINALGFGRCRQQMFFDHFLEHLLREGARLHHRHARLRDEQESGDALDAENG
jgi:hypothetical protein